MISVIFLILGYKSYQNIAKEGAPQIKVPYIFVSVYAEGFSPEDGERMILKPLERELSKIQGVKNITAYSYLNNASVVVEFVAGIDNAVAMNDVRAKVDTAKVQFPQEVKEPTVSEVDFSAMPVLNVAILSENSQDNMKIARDLKDEIESIPEILKVAIRGEKVDVVEIIISPQKLAQYGISIGDIAKIQNNNKLIASGIIRSKSGEYSVKVPSVIKDYAEIKKLPIKKMGGVTVKLEDVASVVKTYKEQATIARINGKEVVVLEISKRSGANIINTIQKVHEKVDAYAKSVSSVIQILYMRDASEKIKDSLNNLMNNILLAVIIVFVMVMNIVGFRQALLISFSVPLSFFISIWVFYVFDISLNIVVLFGLVLSTGMIVDATSVIVEYASQRISAGVSKQRAYLEATHRMLWPIIISTATVLIVSAPLLAWPGVIGGFMKYLPLTLIIVLTSSLFVALFLMPTFGAILDSKNQEISDEANIEDKTLSEILEMNNLTGWYARVLNKTLKKPLTSLFLLLGISVVIIVIYAMFNRGVEFFPNIETDYVRAYVRGVGNLSLDEKDKVMQEVAGKIQKHIGKEIDIFYSYAGGSSGGGENMPKDTIGVIDVQLVSWDLRRRAGKIIADLQANVKQNGFFINFDKQKDGPPQSTDINYEVYGASILKITKALDEMRAYLKTVQGLENVEDTRTPERIEYQIIVDKISAMKYGIDVATISSYVKLATNGVLIDKFSESHLDEKTEIILRYEASYRNIARLMSSVVVVNGRGVPIANFVKVKKQQEIGEIIKKNGKLMYAIRANIKEKYTDENGQSVAIVKSVQKAKILENLQKISKKHSIELVTSGTDEDQKETGAFLQTSFGLALIIIFLIFVVEFNSIGYSLIILSSVFLSIVGVLLGLVISQNSMSIVMCGLGIISLAGIVVSNNLIYLDFFQTLQKNGVNEHDALIKAGILRGKAIILTSGTNVIGLLPAMFGVNIDFATGLLTVGSPTSQWWIQLSSTIAGGLTFATALTLFFTPSNTLLYLNFKRYVLGVVNKLYAYFK